MCLRPADRQRRRLELELQCRPGRLADVRPTNDVLAGRQPALDHGGSTVGGGGGGATTTTTTGSTTTTTTTTSSTATIASTGTTQVPPPIKDQAVGAAPVGGTVLLDGQPFTGGVVPFGGTFDTTNG